MQSVYVEGSHKPFTANGAILANRRVKLSSANTVKPCQVEYAGAGDACIGVAITNAADTEIVTVKLLTAPGTFLLKTSGAVAQSAPLYGTSSGRVDDSGTGTTQFVALDAGSSGDEIECTLYPAVSTTAATVSVADSNGNMTGSTVEAVLNELEVATKTAQYLIQPAGPITLETGAPTLVFANGAADGMTQLTDKEVVLRWNNGANPTKMAARFIIPPDLDPAAAIIVHFLGAIIKVSTTEADSPTITCEAYFAAAGAAMLADTNCGGTSGEFLTAATNTYQEKTLTIAAADIPAVASVMTLIFNPTDGQLPADDFCLAGVWLEATRQNLTS